MRDEIYRRSAWGFLEKCLWMKLSEQFISRNFSRILLEGFFSMDFSETSFEISPGFTRGSLTGISLAIS